MKQITLPVWKYVLSMLIAIVCGAALQYAWLGVHTVRLLLVFLIVVLAVNLSRSYWQGQNK